MKKTDSASTAQFINHVVNYLEKQTQYAFEIDERFAYLTQREDSKKMIIDLEQIEKVLVRTDGEGSEFLQINFCYGSKILLTKSLIGFKPSELVGFDLSRIPRVVTTMDLASVSKAIEDLFDIEENSDTKAEIEVLKRVYQSILLGAENVGFKMCAEKKWISSILLTNSTVVA